MAMTFKELYDKAPDGLKSIINHTSTIEQSPEWHPEGDVFIHTEIVTNRLSKYNDINLSLAGLFHDLGKIDASEYNHDKGTWSAGGHENFSVKYANKYSDWITELGGDSELVVSIVFNHMRIKFIDDMKYSKKSKLVSHPYFEYFRKFQTADYGGVNIVCKSPIDVSLIQKSIKKQKINILQRFFDTFYIKGLLFLTFGEYYVMKTKRPVFQKVKNGIRNSKRIQIRL